MLPDNRLDFISNIDPEFINMMTGARADFIKIDNEIRKLSDLPEAQKDGVNRCISLARTNIEIALQYTIKAGFIILTEASYELYYPITRNERKQRIFAC